MQIVPKFQQSAAEWSTNCISPIGMQCELYITRKNAVGIITQNTVVNNMPTK